MAAKAAAPKAAPAKTAAPSVASQLAAVNAQIQATTLSVAQSLATQNQTAQTQLSAAQAQALTYQQQISNLQSAAAQKTVANVATNTNAAGYDVTTITYSDGTTSSSTATTMNASVQGQRQSIFDTVTKLFTDYGVLKTDPATGKLDAVSQSLSDTINGLAMSGSGQDAISIALQQTDAYKARFAGNTARLAAGLNVLDPATYLALENQYTSVLKAAGVPSSFYSSPAALSKLIGADISPTEVQQRADMAVASVQNADPYYTTTLKNYYGLTQGDMVAHLLDPTVATSILQQQVGTTQIGAEAARQGLSTAAANAQMLYAAGVTEAQARAGYGNVAQALPAGQMLSGIYGAQTGINYDQTKAEQQYLLNSGAAALEQQKLTDLEKNQFSGRSGIAGAQAQTGYTGSLGKSIQGSF